MQITMSEHFERLGANLSRTVEAYNSTVGSLEKNVLSSARKLRELRPVGAKQLDEGENLEATPRALDASKWIA